MRVSFAGGRLNLTPAKRCSKCGIYEDAKPGSYINDPNGGCYKIVDDYPEPDGDHDFQEQPEPDCPICGEAVIDCECRHATCECGHSHQDHYPGTEDCDVKGCPCRKFVWKHGPDPKDFDPTESELTSYNGPQ